MQNYKYCHSYINYIGLKGGKKSTNHGLQQLHIMNKVSCITGFRDINGLFIVLSTHMNNVQLIRLQFKSPSQNSLVTGRHAVDKF